MSVNPTNPPSTRDLQAFVTVAEELSFRRAAERLNMDQSALSRRVQNLEQQLGFQLFFRTTREVSLTEAGKVLFENTRFMLKDLLHATEIARSASTGKRGSIRIGYMSFSATEILPESVRRFSEIYPEIQIELQYMSTQNQKIALSRNDIDAGFMLGPFNHPQYESVVVANESLVAVLPMNHWLSTRKFVTIRDLGECKLVLGSVEEWDFFRRIVEELFNTEGLSITDKIRFEASTTLGILGLVASGLGISIYAEGLKRFQPRQVVFKEIENCEQAVQTIFCWNRAYVTPIIRNFTAVVNAQRHYT